ncbi:MAG TPA: transketolase [Spirochaetota bacterium]|nr:transketolase [Spirochaetota bacterium]
MPVNRDELKLIARTVRTLSMDIVQKANSGHPGMPMGCADIAAVLWGKVMNFNSSDPAWVNRDRFILSAGHGSVLLYSMLHLTGYDVTLDDLKQFRQMGSITPGHPEYRHTPGVETTTGPLGQGFANGVGMGIAEKLLAEEFNSAGSGIIDHYIYVIAGDGCIMEGISSEAASLAGHMKLGNLIYIYDSNSITIEGSTDLAFTEDVRKRFESYGWDVSEIDGHDYDEIEKSLLDAQKVKDKPSLIIARTSIAKGSATMEGSESSHGAPLGDVEIKASKEKLGCSGDSLFEVPEEVYEIFRRVNEEKLNVFNTWKERFDKAMNSGLESKWNKFFAAPDAEKLRNVMPSFKAGDKIATRNAGGKMLEVLYGELPNFLGGSADLSPSNKTHVKNVSESSHGKVGRIIHYGVRENAMGSIQNGIAYYGGFINFSATFLVFMDYMRPAVRMAALAGLQSIYVYTHDSVFVGEDGPTHQPVEHLAVSRAIPNLNVIRPCDAEETREAWIAAVTRKNGPTMLALSRQNLTVLDRDEKSDAINLHKGAYVVYGKGAPELIILASGSEVGISVDAAKIIESENGKPVTVVSFPSWELFDEQSEDYRKSILPVNVKKAVVEAGIRMGWEKYAGEDALFITVDEFGRSAPADDIADYFGFTPEKIAERVRKYLA